LTAPGFAAAQSSEVYMEESIGSEAAGYQHKWQFKSFANTIIIDGSTLNDDTEAKVHDHTLLNLTVFQGELPFGQRFSVRPSLLTETSIHIEEDDNEPKKISKETRIEVVPRLDLTYTTESQIDVLAGVGYLIIPDYEMNAETYGLKTVTAYSEVTVPSFHVGFAKRFGSVAGGFYYRAGSQRSRNVKKFSSQDESELNFEDQVYSPPILSLFFKMDMGKSSLSGEFSEVQASEGGNRSATGEAINDNYTVAKGSATFPITSDFLLRSTLIYRSSTYTDAQNVSLTSIPLWALYSKLVLGSSQNHQTFIGLIYLRGRDRQSLPEFNADYKVDGYGVNAGLNLNF
jgi:hypothetical protein